MAITGIYTKDFPDLGRDAGATDLIPIAEVGNIVTKKTPVSGLITSARVVGALGFTPYDATNPAGYITSAALSGYLPLAGGTLESSGSANTLNINHTSGSGIALNILKNGNGEALTIVKGSGSGNAASITGGITLLSELNLTTKLADAHIASAATWNAKQNALNGTGFVKISGTTISYDNSSYALASSLGNYLPLTGGTLTGALFGTTASFTSSLTATNGTFITTATTGTSELLRLSRNVNGYGYTAFKQSYDNTYFTAGKTLTLTNDSNIDFAHFASNNAGTITNFILPNGNLGLGVTPSAWRNGDIVIDLGATTSLVNAQGLNTRIYTNAFLATGGISTYKTNGFATYYDQGTGGHRWFTAPSGTAGNAISFTQAMTLDASGNLSLGSNDTSFQWTNSGNNVAINATSGALSLYTGTSSYAERMRITSGGNVLIGTTTDAGFRLDVNGTARVQGVLTTTADAVVNGVSVGRGGGSITTNTRVGTNALLNNTTGAGNSVFGEGSGSSITTGGSNSLFGRSSGSSITTGLANTAFGTFAGLNITTGAQNLFFGFNSGRFIADGITANTLSSTSIFIGSNAKALANEQGNQIVIGHESTGLGSNTTVLGNSSTVTTAIYGNLLLGTTTAAGYKLDVNGTGRFSGNTTGAIATFVNTNTTGTGNGILVDVNSQLGTDNYVMNLISNGTSRMYVREDGNVGIGTIIPTEKLEVAGNGNLGIKIRTSTNTASDFSALRYAQGGSEIAATYTNLGNYILSVAGVEAMRMTSARNLLIGTTTDAGYKLDVNGTFRATSLIKSGGTSSQFLKADGSVDSSAYITGLSWAGLTGKPTTISGFGITDAVSNVQGVQGAWTGTQAQYDAIATKSSTTIYFIQ